ncbi:unnamed protein product, partial [Ascophyllum nodosum]
KQFFEVITGVKNRRTLDQAHTRALRGCSSSPQGQAWLSQDSVKTVYSTPYKEQYQKWRSQKVEMEDLKPLREEDDLGRACFDDVNQATDGADPKQLDLGILLNGDDDQSIFDHNDELLGEDQSPSGSLDDQPTCTRFWRVDTPLHVEPPPTFNAPPRVKEQTQEEQIKASAFSPAAFSRRKYELPPSLRPPEQCGNVSTGGKSMSPAETFTAPSAGASTSLRQKQAASVRGRSDNNASCRTAMSDYYHLAFSSQRSGRHKMEGFAHFSAGVTMDSVGQYGRALESYRKFLAVCKSLNDPQMEGVCHNCMGVDYMLMACPPGSNMQDRVGKLPATSVTALSEALEHHEAHLKVADDAGSGVAHSNIGLCHGLLGDYSTAAIHHQEALRASLRAQSFNGQSVAAGNLGTLAMREGDYKTAAACLEQRLHLVQQLGDWEGEIHTWSRMAEIAAAGAGNRKHFALSKRRSPQISKLEKSRIRSDGGVGNDATDDEEVQDLTDGEFDRKGVLGSRGGRHGPDTVTRALRCFERAAALAKSHSEMNTLKRLYCDMGILLGNASMDDYFRELQETACAACTGRAP